jgi:hypothetical protein
MDPENKKIYASVLKVKSGEYRFTVKESSRSGRYLLVEDARLKKGKFRVERIVLYPESLTAFDAQYQRAREWLASAGTGGDSVPNPAGEQGPQDKDIPPSSTDGHPVL